MSLNNHKGFMMKILPTKLPKWVILIVFIMTVYIGINIYLGHQIKIHRISHLADDLENYICSHHGKFPKNEEDLKSFGVTNQNALKRSSLPFGIKLDDIKVSNGKLFDTNGEQILLIQYEEKDYLTRRRCEKISLKLYNKMVELQNKYNGQNT